MRSQGLESADGGSNFVKTHTHTDRPKYGQAQKQNVGSKEKERQTRNQK